MIDECFPVRKCSPSLPRGPLRLMSMCQEPPSLCLAVSSHSVLTNCLQSPRTKKKQKQKQKLVCKKLPQKTDLKNQCPDVIINLGIFMLFIACLIELPRWCSGKETACQCRRCRFHPWDGKIPWSRK